MMKKNKSECISQNKSICFILETKAFGGVEAHSLRLIKSLIEYGYIIEIIVNRFKKYGEWIESYGLQDKVTIINVDLGGIHDQKNDAKKWKETLKAICSSILIFPKGHNLHGSVGFLYVCRRKFKKIIFIEHLESELPEKKTSRLWLGLIPGIGFWWYKRQFHKKARSFFANHIIAVSNKVKDSLIKNSGYSSKKIIVVHNGVPWQNFSFNEIEKMAFCCQFQIPPEKFIFGMLTRLNVEKRIDIAIRALSKLLKDDSIKVDISTKPFYLVVAGEGPEIGNLEELVNTLNLNDYVKFIGFINDPKKVLSGYDVILFSSRIEGLPLALLEGMAAGCIPIVTRVSGMPEAVNSNDIGLVVSPENPEELYMAMKHILMLDKSILLQMRRCAVRRIQEKFDIDQSHRTIIEIIES